MADNGAASTTSAKLAATRLVRVAVSKAFDLNFAAIGILDRYGIGFKQEAMSNNTRHNMSCSHKIRSENLSLGEARHSSTPL